jgi:hypothetical protein
MAAAPRFEEIAEVERLTDDELRERMKHKHSEPIERSRNEADDFCQPERYF